MKQWWIILVMWLDIKLMATAYSDLILDYLIGAELFCSHQWDVFVKKSCVHSSLFPDWGQAVYAVYQQRVQSEEDALQETVWSVWGQNRGCHEVSQPTDQSIQCMTDKNTLYNKQYGYNIVFSSLKKVVLYKEINKILNCPLTLNYSSQISSLIKAVFLYMEQVSSWGLPCYDHMTSQIWLIFTP